MIRRIKAAFITANGVLDDFLVVMDLNWWPFPQNNGVKLNVLQFVSLHFTIESTMSSFNISQLLQSKNEIDVSMQAYTSIDPVLSELDDVPITFTTLNFTQIKYDSIENR